MIEERLENRHWKAVKIIKNARHRKKEFELYLRGFEGYFSRDDAEKEYRLQKFMRISHEGI